MFSRFKKLIIPITAIGLSCYYTRPVHNSPNYHVNIDFFDNKPTYSNKHDANISVRNNTFILLDENKKSIFDNIEIKEGKNTVNVGLFTYLNNYYNDFYYNGFKYINYNELKKYQNNISIKYIAEITDYYDGINKYMSIINDQNRLSKIEVYKMWTIDEFYSKRNSSILLELLNDEIFEEKIFNILSNRELNTNQKIILTNKIINYIDYNINYFNNIPNNLKNEEIIDFIIERVYYNETENEKKVIKTKLMNNEKI